MSKLFYSSELFLQAGVVNAVSLRVEGKPDNFSMKRSAGHDGSLNQNRAEYFRSLGFDEGAVASARQVHGDTIRLVKAPGVYPETDGLITKSENLLLAISVADCVPILVADMNSRTVAAVHAGWRGTAKGIAGKAIDFMRRELNCSPQNIFAFIGPSAGICCYEVGDEVARHFHGDEIRNSSRTGKFMLDLKSANLSQLVDHGVPKENIEVSKYCTICDTHFHSFRREGEASGRMLAVVAIRSRE